MRLLLLPLLLGTLLLFESCASWQQGKWLKAHQTELARIANGTMPTEQKVDALFTTYAVLMEQGLKFTNPVKGAKYIEKFQKQNQASIEKILGEADKWRSGMNIQDGIALGLNVPKKTYIKQYIDLVPKFKRKYNQYKFILDLTSKIGGGFGKIIGGVL